MSAGYYLRDQDYTKIRPEVLAQLVAGLPDGSTRQDIEAEAIDEMKSKLVQRYNCDEEFAPILEFNDSDTYGGLNLVEYTEPVFSATVVYLTAERVSYQKNIYSSKAGSAAHAFDVTEWNLVCKDLSLFSVIIPYPLYISTTKYFKNDLVWRLDNHIWKALQDNTGVIPGTNTQVWQDMGSYDVTGVLPTDSSIWKPGDTRAKLLRMYLIDMVLYHLHANLNPRDIPELRYVRYREAKNWLKEIASGDANAIDLPELDPLSGNSITWGSQEKTSNFGF